jgi:transcription elongation GreA/GreB family factor
MNIKQELYKKCQEFVSRKLSTIEKTIKSNKNDLNSETKSSAGDKHETGRAMLQLEMEKAGQQLVVANEMQFQLERIDFSSTSNFVKLGSLIRTDQFNYFIAVSAGRIIVDKKIFFAISSNSPVGKLLLGREQGETILFREQKIKITDIM